MKVKVLVKKGKLSDDDYEESDSRQSDDQFEIEPESESSEESNKRRRKRQQAFINEWQYKGERPKRQRQRTVVVQETSPEESQHEEEPLPEENIFEPEVENILSRKLNDQQQFEYYIKYKNHSYLWCEWLTEENILKFDKSGRQKINRFNRIFEKKLLDIDPEELQDTPLVDPSYVEIDRIINTTEMFPIIHPKKANEIKNKWNEYLMIIVSKLLNFYIGKIKYGVYFMTPVNPEQDHCPDYRKIILQPMDLGTVYNRLHLDYYKNSQQFWYELGLVFKNCRKFTPDPHSDIRILCDTLGEIALKLYTQWHPFQALKFQEYSNMATQRTDGVPLSEELERQLLNEKVNYTRDLAFWNPGDFTYSWFDETENFVPSFVHTEGLVVDLKAEHEQLYLIKWKGLSYMNATWEVIKELPNAQAKLVEFRQFNRSLDKENRTLQLKNSQRHRNLLDYDQKKKKNITQSEINDLKTQLYQLDIGRNKKPFQYTARTQTIYKDRKLLRDYQLDSLNWMIDAYYSNRNVLLADEMGLGKTIQSIAFLYHLHQMEQCKGPFLIIAPLSTLQHWKRSCEDWTVMNAVLYYDSQGQPGRQSIRDYEWYYTDISMKGNMISNQDLFKFTILITSYEVFNQDHATVLQYIPFQFIIVDEAHRLKNQNAKILNSLKRLICPRIMILTGTPVQNNPDELWSLLNFIEQNHFPSLSAFKREFGDLTTAEQIEKLNKTLKPYILRRQKEDVEQSIPPLQENIIDVELTNIQKTLYRALYERNKAALIQGFSQQTAQIASLNNLDMHLRKLCNHPLLLKEMYQEMVVKLSKEGEEYHKILIEWSGKMILLDKMLQKFLKQEKKKVLIFSQFTNMLALIEEYLKNNLFKYEKITGDIKQIDRQNAIDRFNDQKKGREVFLLSTKAGGQGINLTAAEIVVIFDSDWNPQNDIQATARAHRIGQDKQVAVYRLITKNTYEAKMYERAVAKLGLDQAIFLGGEFKSANNNAADNPQQKKLSKKEMEILLKQGSLGLLEQFGRSDGNCQEQMNIDQILSNTRVAKYSLINGSYTISKQTFVPEQSSQVNLNDPNFWQIVLKNHESRSQKLLKLVSEDVNVRTQAQQKQVMTELAECINSVIEAKLSMEGYDADEEQTLGDILTTIGFHRSFDKAFKDLANMWIDEMARPSRRFKKIQFQDISQLPEREVPTVDNGKKPEFEWSEYEEYKKLQTKTAQDLQVRLCTICEKPKCNVFCRGFCRKQFHKECLDGPTDITAQQQQPQQPTQPNNDEINIKFLCEDCSKFMGLCFQCTKVGNFYPTSGKKKKNRVIQEQEFLDFDESPPEHGQLSGKRTTRSRSTRGLQNQNPELVKCSAPSCHKLYHFACVETSRSFRIQDGVAQRFKCPLHYCEKCKDRNTEEGQNMLQCLRCPRSFHAKCLPKGIVKKTKKYMICPAHKEESVQQPLIKKKVKTEQGSKKSLKRLEGSGEES